MAHTRGGGVGNMAGSDDRTIEELVADIRARIVEGDGYGDITEDELNKLLAEKDEKNG